MKALLILSFILGAAGALGCEDDPAQTPCERYAEAECDCYDLNCGGANGTWGAKDIVEVCESYLNDDLCDYEADPEGCKDSIECRVECSKLDNCDQFTACGDECSLE